MASTRRGVRVLSALLGAAMLIAASTVPAGAGEMPDAPPVKIGTTIASTEQLGFKGRLVGIQAAVRAINKRGGINGRKVEWIDCRAANAGEGEACSRRMVSEGVVAIINPANFFAEQADTEIFGDAGVAQIDPFTFTEEARQAPTSFFLDGGISAEYVGVPQWMKRLKLKTLHYLAGADSSSQNILGLLDTASRFYDIEHDGTTEIPLTAADHAPYVANAADADADVYVQVIAPFQTTAFLRAGQQLGQKLRIAGVEGQLTHDQYEEYGQPGGILDKALFPGPVPPITAKNDFPEMKRFLRELKAERKAGNEDAELGNVAGQAIRAWLATQAFIEVAETIQGDVTAASFLEAMNTVQDVELGLIPPWTPSAEGPPRFTKVSNPYSWLITVKNGKPVLASKKPMNTLIPFEEGSTE